MFTIAVFLVMILSSLSLPYRRHSLLSKSLNSFQTPSMNSYVPKVLVAIADGSEEIETTTIFDTLVRGGAVSIIYLNLIAIEIYLLIFG